jgi:hypothetical protein
LTDIALQKFTCQIGFEELCEIFRGIMHGQRGKKENAQQNMLRKRNIKGTLKSVCFQLNGFAKEVASTWINRLVVESRSHFGGWIARNCRAPSLHVGSCTSTWTSAILCCQGWPALRTGWLDANFNQEMF